MKLTRLRIRNFRCYKDEIAVNFDDMTAFVGRNDVGKSTVMDALDIFLNEGAPDKHDATKDGDGKDLTIICEFTGLPASVVIDEENPTTFSAEHLLNAAGRLEIHKTFSGHLATPKCTSVAALAVHPTADGVSDLLQLKNSELKKRAEKLNVDLTGIDPKVNAQLRQRIRETVSDLKLSAVLVPLNDDKTNKLWDRIKVHVPLFALFKSDRASTDQDPEAQDPLKKAVQEAIKQRESELNLIAAHVESEVRQIAKATLEKLKVMDETLAQQLNPQISIKKWDTLFNVSITGDEDIPINKRGSGVKRLVLLNFFRARAEQKSLENSKAPVIYGIEEPETSQHPHNQRLLVTALMDLAADNQVVITTHTPMLARTLPDKCLRFINLKADKTREVLEGGDTTNKLFASSLGMLPDNSIKLFVGVEGRHDITFLKHLAKMLLQAGCDVLDLETMELEGEVIFFPLGGSSLALWTSRLEPLARPEFYLFDRDELPPAAPKYQTKAEEINRRARCKAVVTGKREMENYLHYEAINEAYTRVCGIKLGLEENFAAFDDVPAKVAKMVHEASGSGTAWSALDEETRGKKVSKAKQNLNQHAACSMTKARLDEVDPDGDVISWFAEMAKLAKLQ